MNTNEQMWLELMTVWECVENEQPAAALRRAKAFRFRWKWKRKRLPRFVLKELQRVEMYAGVMVWLGGNQ
jgi:hypothetical protein